MLFDSLTAGEVGEVLQRARILYVEDYELVLFTAKQLLESENWIVDACRDAYAARKKIESDDSYDLLILNEKGRGTVGLELLHVARANSRLRGAPVLIFAAAECSAEAYAVGADAFLPKPGGLKELVETCRRLLHGREEIEGQEAAEQLAAENVG